MAAAILFFGRVGLDRGIDGQCFGGAVGRAHPPVGADRRMVEERHAIRDVTQAGKIRARPLRRGFQPRPLVGTADGKADALLLHHFQRLIGLEHRLQDDRAARCQRIAEHHRDIARPEEAVAGPAAHREALGVDIHDARPAPPLDRQRALRMNDSLGQARRARGKENRAGVGRVGRRGAGIDLRHAHRSAGREEVGPLFHRGAIRGGRAGIRSHAVERDEAAQERKFRADEHAGRRRPDTGLQLGQYGTEVLAQHLSLVEQDGDRPRLQQVFQLHGRGEGAERDRHATGQRDAEHGRDMFRPVGHQDADAGVPAHAGRDQRPGHLDRTLPQLGVGPRHPAAGGAHHQRLARGMAPRDRARVARDRQRPEARLRRQRGAVNDRELRGL